jgi:hypothetical protein
MSEIENTLKKHRDDLLKAEIGALLFNLGKTHIGIGNWKEAFGIKGDEIKFTGYKDYFKNTHFKAELEKIACSDEFYEFFSENVICNPIDQSQKISLIEIMKADCSNNDFVKKVFFKGCENINSGIDKGALIIKQNEMKILFISNAFGSFQHEVEKSNFDEGRNRFLHELHRELVNKEYYNNPDWQKIRDYIIENIKPWYKKLLSDNRLPANDVTLWDQVYMTATLFKATLVDCFLNTETAEKCTNVPGQIKWRILGIQYDKLALAERASKPSIIASYRDDCKRLDDKIKVYMETEMAIGNEIYRDETGIYFLVPEHLSVKETNLNVDLWDDVSLYSKINSMFYDSFKNEVQPVYVLTKACRSTINLTHLLKKANEMRLYAPRFDNRIITEDKSGSQICRVCHIRFAEDNTVNDIPICRECNLRNIGRVQTWLKKRSCETVWLSEIKDKNNRIALITLRFGLSEWLNGNMLSSTINKQLKNYVGKVKDLNYLIDILSKDFENNPKKLVKDSLLPDIVFIKKEHKSISLRKYVQELIVDRSIGTEWEALIESKTGITKKDALKKLTEQQSLNLAYILLQFLFRKNPSPARLRRIWESTLGFTKEIRELLGEMLTANRLVWTIDKASSEGEYEFGSILFWVENGEAILISHLEEKREQLPPEFSISKIDATDKIDLRKSDAREESYKQLVSLLKPTPVSWQVVVPAERVPNIIDEIQNRYKEHFRYVYGKLPLHIGIVVQNYKSPLYIGMKALRNIRREVEWNDIGRVINCSDFDTILKAQILSERTEEIKNNVKNYYSWQLRNDGAGLYQFYFPPNKNRIFLSYADENTKPGDFCYYPNTIDFEYLDCNIRRNDIFYQNGSRLTQHRRQRPFTWEHWEKYKKFKELFTQDTPQLHNLISLFYRLLQDWKDEDQSIRHLASSAVTNMMRKNIMSQEDRGLLANFFNDNSENEITDYEYKKKMLEFLDYYDFWHTTLKEV